MAATLGASPNSLASEVLLTFAACPCVNVLLYLQEGTLCSLEGSHPLRSDPRSAISDLPFALLEAGTDVSNQKTLTER